MQTTLYKGSLIVTGEFISNIPPAQIRGAISSVQLLPAPPPPRNTTPPRNTAPPGTTPPLNTAPPRNTATALGLRVGPSAWRYGFSGGTEQLKTLLNQRTVKGGWVEPNYVVRGQEAPVLQTPNPTLVPPSLLEWWIRNDGQEIDGVKGTSGIDINALKAWAIAKGSRNVAVAILDSGLDDVHADLVPNLWTSQRPFRLSLNGAPHDCGAGYEQIRGVNCLPPTVTSLTSDWYDVKDAHSHGTRMAGLVGAVHGGGGGSTGVNPRVTLIPIKVLDSQLYGSIDSVVNGLDCALQIAECGLTECMRLTVILASWGFWSAAPSTPLQDMLERLRQKNMLVVCSAFNCEPDAAGNLDLQRVEQIGAETCKLDYYLPAFANTSLLAVTASDHRDQLVAGYGPTRIDIRAPGYAINCPTPEAGCSTVNGASAAAALAAGVAALVQSRCPQITAAELRDCLIKGASGPTLGKTANGRLNALQALMLSPCASRWIPEPGPAATMSTDCYSSVVTVAPGLTDTTDPMQVTWEVEQTSDEYVDRPKQKDKNAVPGATVWLEQVGTDYYCVFSDGWKLKLKLCGKTDATGKPICKPQDFSTAEKTTAEYSKLALSIQQQSDYSYFEFNGPLKLKGGPPAVEVNVKGIFVPIMEPKGTTWFTHFVLVLVNGDQWPPLIPLGMQGGVLHGSGNNG